MQKAYEKSKSDKSEIRRHNVLSINVEEYFQVQAFAKFIPPSKWSKLDSHIEFCVESWMQLLDENKSKATFFAIASTIQQNAKVFRQVIDYGHEVATMGLEYKRPSAQLPILFEKNLKNAIEITQSITGKSVIGYRTPVGWLKPNEIWIFDCLSRAGILYDSSECEIARNVRDRMGTNSICEFPTNSGRISRIPIATTTFVGRTVPIGGGNWVRQMPNPLLKKMISNKVSISTPVVYYFNSWELDDNQPIITSHQKLSKLRHYRNLDGMKDKIKLILRNTTTESFVNVLGYNQVDIVSCINKSVDVLKIEVKQIDPRSQPLKVTILVPMFNEVLAINTLSKCLRSLIFKSMNQYEFEIIIVDDGSTDDTYLTATKEFDNLRNCRILKHDVNKGLSQALMTGANHAVTSIICCIDADCTYDPELLLEMLPKLSGDTVIVTASPYHSHGKVLNVPVWRVALSKMASQIYSYILKNKLRTYTSCFRVYNKDVLLQNLPSESGFLGITQILINADLKGYKIVEHPAILEPRLLGSSKMKTIKTIVGHLRLIYETIFKIAKMKFKFDTLVPQIR